MLISPAAALSTLLAPSGVSAQAGQVRLQADLEYVLTDSETTNEDAGSPEFGEQVDTETSYFQQRYQAELRKELYPYLDVVGGGFFELIDSKTNTEGTHSGFDQQTDRLYGELNWTNPLYTGSGAYRRSRFLFDPRNLSSQTLRREEISGLWRWRPVGLPRLDAEYSRFRTWDDEGQRDSVSELLVFKTRYDYRNLSTDYTYTRTDQEERILDTGSLTQIHNGGLRYAHAFLDDRLQATGAARINYDNLRPSDGADVLLPTPLAGAPFFFLDDDDNNTLTIVDANNPLSTINIGNGGPMNPVSVGLDFTQPTEVDTIHVFPVLPEQDPSNPNLATPGEISAESVSWQVFTSDDQMNWQPVGPPRVAPYDVFENRWEIVLDALVEKEFIKVVTVPITDAPKEIRIARLRAFTTVAGAPGLEIETLTQNYNVGLRWEVTDETTVNFDSLARIQDSQTFGERKTTLTNSVGLQHDFNPIFYGTARLLRTDITETGRDDIVRHSYTASLTGDYLPSLSQRLVYSGSHDEQGSRTGYANSIFLRTNARVYREWGVNLDIGFSARSPVRGTDSTSSSLRLSTNIVPNPKLTVTVDYRGSWETESGQEPGYLQIGGVQAFWVPLRTLSLGGGYNFRDDPRDDRGLQDSQNLFVNWSPFPDGQLQFGVTYNHTIDTRNVEVRDLTPRIDWQITRTTVLTVSYGFGTIDGELESRDTRTLRANLRSYY